jgi:hypothetical protein
VRDEGGDASAHAAALNIIKTEIVLMRENKLLGGTAPWFIHNPMSKRIEFMHLETRFSDMFEQAWKTTTTHINPSKSIKDTAASGVAQTPEKVPAVGNKRAIAEVEGGNGEAASSGSAPKVKAAKKGTGKDKGEDKQGTGDAAKDAKALKQKEVTKQTNELKVLKNKLLTASAAGKAVLDTIRTSAEWEYFNNESSTKPLRSALVMKNFHTIAPFPLGLPSYH